MMSTVPESMETRDTSMLRPMETSSSSDINKDGFCHLPSEHRDKAGKMDPEQASKQTRPRDAVVLARTSTVHQRCKERHGHGGFWSSVFCTCLLVDTTTSKMAFLIFFLAFFLSFAGEKV